MRKKSTTYMIVVLVGVLLGVGVLIGMRYRDQPTEPQKPIAAPQKNPPDAKVASAHTATQTTVLPDGRPVRVVVSDGHQQTVVSPDLVGDEQGQTAEPMPRQPTTPSAPHTPQTVTINLRGPLTATLLPGQHTPILTYEMTDDVPFEWFPGVSAGWMDTPKPPDAPVWSTVLEHQSSQPYVSSYVHFFIAANTKAAPGTYKVSVRLRLTPQVTLGIPVMVTVPAPAAPYVATAPPG